METALPPTSLWFWIGFNAFIFIAILLDLTLFHKKSEPLSLKQSGIMVAIWVAVAALFCLLTFHWLGEQKAWEFASGYLIEISLSMDNVFVFAMIFRYFQVPIAYQYRALFWGIIGALVMRGVMIWAGSALVHEFAWVMYGFGAFLIYTGIKMLRHSDETIDPNSNMLVRLSRKLFKTTDTYVEDKFFVKLDGTWHVTPLFLVLLMIDFADVVFAVDSIPAIFAITLDRFILYTSNALAIIGLRSLYFLLAGMLNRFYYLNHGLCVLLVFIGGKMLLVDVVHISTQISLLVIIAILAMAAIASAFKVKG